MVDKFMERIGLDAGLTCRELREFAAIALAMGLPDWARRMHALADRWTDLAIDSIEEAASEETNPCGIAVP
jgi:hypothetical protein